MVRLGQTSDRQHICKGCIYKFLFLIDTALCYQKKTRKNKWPNAAGISGLTRTQSLFYLFWSRGSLLPEFQSWSPTPIPRELIAQDRLLNGAAVMPDLTQN